MFWAAAARFGKLFLAAVGLTVALSALFGLLLGVSIDRALSVGFYLVGSFLMLMGFFVGNRGPARLKSGTDATPFTGTRALRWATAHEREETLNFSALFVVLGLTLIMIGVATDSRHRLV
jgi:hypothetical protein